MLPGTALDPHLPAAPDGLGYLPAVPLSREAQQDERLQSTVGVYRLLLDTHVRTIWLRIDLTPPAPTAESTRSFVMCVTPDGIGARRRHNLDLVSWRHSSRDRTLPGI